MTEQGILDKHIAEQEFVEKSLLEDLPTLFSLLLIDRTTSTKKKAHNIIWATDNYMVNGKGFDVEDEIQLKSITGRYSELILPRALKDKQKQKERTKTKAEVFTPTWIVKKQNDSVDEYYQDDDLDTYVGRTWLEITCGEAPYMATRYDMMTGDIVPLEDRVGFIDRKIKRINAEIDDKDKWVEYVKKAYKSSYGYEWSGDSLLLARQNLLFAFIDYYVDRFNEAPSYQDLTEIAEIITYNVFQMDGLKFIIPFSEKFEKVPDGGLVFPGQEPVYKTVHKKGKRVKVMDWTKNKYEFFDKDIKKK